ncbi:MAG: ankyrin repeat domain-containing protein, partial [Methyloligellaceae bacterium]
MVDKPNLEYLKKTAKALKKQADDGNVQALERIIAVFTSPPDRLKLADCQHVIAHEQGYESWPKLKFSIEARNMTRVERIQQLIMALYYGRFHIIDRLLEMDATLGDAHFGIQVALYKKDAVFAALEQEPALVSRLFGPRSAFLHLCYSRYCQHKPEKTEDMLAIAKYMIELGADVNDSYKWEDGSPLSALYGALGHANNIKLAELLLENGANPNDGESLYHATELGHLDGLKLLMQYGVDASSDHHWIRILDFDEYEGA